MTTVIEPFSIDDELSASSQLGDLYAVRHWLEQGANPNHKDGSAYILAVANDHVSVVDFLYPLVNDTVRAFGLQIAAFNENNNMIDYLYQSDHARLAARLLETQFPKMGAETVLKNRLAHERVPLNISQIKRKIYN